MPRMEESHAARSAERATRLRRVLPQVLGSRPPTIHPPAPAITAEQRAALERASRARAEEELPGNAPARKTPSLLEERQASAPPRGELFVPGHFSEPVVAGRRSFLTLRDELTAPGSALERYAGRVAERRDDEGYAMETDPFADYISLGRDPDRPAYDRLVRLQWYSASTLDKLLGGHRRKVASYRPVDYAAIVWKGLGMPGDFSVPALLAEARKVGVLLALAGEATAVVRWYEGGRILPIGHRVGDLLELAEPLVVAELAGVPVSCAIDGCRPERHDAVTMAGPGVPWCRQQPDTAPEGARR